MIELKNIDVIFNSESKLVNHVLKALSFQVHEGDFVTIIGGNGAGKSTLMNVISGDIRPNAGQIAIDELNVTKLSTEERSSMVARVFQDPMIGTYANLTIEENMSIAYKRGKSRGLDLSITQELRTIFKDALSELEMNLENRLDTVVSNLSGGQRQALSLVMATIQGSKILLLDEHTAALDPKIAKLTMDLTAKIIDKHKLTTLMITHSMTQALNYGNRTVIMHQGKIVKDIRGKERSDIQLGDLMKYFDF